MDNSTDKILVTGAAGFIGYHLTTRLLREGRSVVGIDNLNDYYDVNLKHSRLKILKENSNFQFFKIDLSDRQDMENIFKNFKFSAVVNLAAQAGVRYSLSNPYPYITSNVNGFLNILEGCRHGNVGHLVYASSSSVYGANKKLPFSTEDNVDHPISLYAATKKANELMAHSYSHLYRTPTTGLRFFTVYGPWGRPDLSLFIFTKAILEGKPIQVFNYGKMQRDFTYIDDIVEGIVRVIKNVPTPRFGAGDEITSTGYSSSPYAIYNIGNNDPVPLMEMIETLEKALGKKAEKILAPMQNGDVPATYADVNNLIADVGFKPSISIQHGISRFVEWYREYYNV